MDEKAPFRLPISRKSWFVLVFVGFFNSFILMAVVRELTKVGVVGPVSLAEVIGFGFTFVWMFVFLGPLSPFKTTSP